MSAYTKSELEEALRAIRSTIGKCEKVLPKLREGTSQHTLLVRRIKAFQIAVALMEREMENQGKVFSGYDNPIYEYRRLLRTTDLQKGYQEFVKFFRQLRTFLQRELPTFAFTGNIVENNMDYSYFQFTNEQLKAEGLKIVIAFVHADFEFQVWLSGVNREIQTTLQQSIKPNFTEASNDYPYPLTLTDNPTKTDYVISAKLVDDCDYSHLDELLTRIKENSLAFMSQVALLLAHAKRPQ